MICSSFPSAGLSEMSEHVSADGGGEQKRKTLVVPPSSFFSPP